ncbi:MAG: PEP-CTERM sorting domain-containing protein [Fimbriimonas sp.]
MVFNSYPSDRPGNSNYSKAAIWYQGTTTQLPIPEWATSTFGMAIGEAGDVVGAASGGGYHFSPLGVTGPGLELRDVNVNGIAVGMSSDSGPASIRSDRQGNITKLTGLNGSNSFYAYGLNDVGDVVGVTGLGSNGRATLLMQNGTKVDLGMGTALDINNSGDVLVTLSAGAGARIINSAGTTNVPISEAWDMNDRGEVVGWDSMRNTSYWRDGQVYALNSLIVEGPSDVFMTQAYDISDSGWIVGEGGAPGYSQVAIALEPVPEPATVVAVILGAGSVFLRRRRKA